MNRRILRRRIIVAALTGLALFVGTSTVHAQWYWRMRRVYPMVQQTVPVQAAPTETVAVPVEQAYPPCPPRQTRYRSGFPQSSQGLYHNLGKWPPY
jgi:hypothetical protein